MSLNTMHAGTTEKQEAHQLVGGQNASPLKFDLKPSEAAFSAVFSNFDIWWPEEADDVITAGDVV